MNLRYLSAFPIRRPRAVYPRDLRGAPSGCLLYWRPRRSYQPARRFHALGRLGIGRSYHERAVLVSGLWPPSARPEPCACCGQLNPKGMATDYCQICLDYMWRNGGLLPAPERFPRPLPRSQPTRRAPIARPFFFFVGDRLLASRQRPHPTAVPGLYHAWWHRPRTRFCYNRFHARYYALRRRLGAQARRLGFQQISQGIWVDNSTGVVYLQSAVDLAPTENVVYALS